VLPTYDYTMAGSYPNQDSTSSPSSM